MKTANELYVGSALKSAKCLALTVLLAVFSTLSVVAQSEGNREEIRAAKEQIQELLAEAERLQERGQHDKAERVKRRALETRERVAKAERRMEREREPEGREFNEILNGLEAGIGALQKLGREEAIEMLKEIASDVRREFGGRERGNENNRERELAMRRLQTMRYAKEGLLEAGREDSAELVQAAIRSLEMALEGRRGEEARRMREAAPNRAQKIELYNYAASLLREQGKTEKAMVVAELAEQLRGQGGRKREPRRERRVSRSEGGERSELRQHMEALDERLLKAQQEINAIKKNLERARAELR